MFQSASKVVFIGVAFTTCIAFIFEVSKGVVVLDPKDFIMLTAMAFSFYFGMQTDQSTTVGGK